MREGAAVFSGSALLEPRLGDVGALGTQRATFVAGIGVAHVTGERSVYLLGGPARRVGFLRTL